MKRKVIKILIGSGIVVIALVLAGIIYQTVGSMNDARRFPPPGKIVSIGSTRMHLNCTGSGGPTVVLEAGATGFSSTWAWVQRDLENAVRVCSYDRSGLGWSEKSKSPRDADLIAEELHDLLQKAGEVGPFIVVGHSMGGVFIRAFAAKHPDLVAGLVFVDSSHPDQLKRFPPEFVEEFKSFVSLTYYARFAAHIGILRLTNAIGSSAEGLAEREYNEVAAFAASPVHLATSYEELALWDRSMEEGGKLKTLGSRPVYVLSAEFMTGVAPEIRDINHEMHKELAGLSSNGTYRVVKGADHFSIIMKKEFASQVAGAIKELVEKIGPSADSN